MGGPHDPSDEHERDLRRRAARGRAVSTLLALLVVVPFMGWRIFRAYEKMARPPAADAVRITVEADGRARYGGRAFEKADADALIAAIAAEHPGASPTLCTGGAEGWGGLLSYKGMMKGVTIGIIDDPRHPLCAP